MKSRLWTQQELDFVAENVNEGKLSDMEIAEKLGRSLGAIKLRISRLAREGVITVKRNNYWEKDEVIFLKENANKLSSAEISEKLGRSRLAIEAKLSEIRAIERGPKFPRNDTLSISHLGIDMITQSEDLEFKTAKNRLTGREVTVSFPTKDFAVTRKMRVDGAKETRHKRHKAGTVIVHDPQSLGSKTYPIRREVFDGIYSIKEGA